MTTLILNNLIKVLHLDISCKPFFTIFYSEIYVNIFLFIKRWTVVLVIWCANIPPTQYCINGTSIFYWKGESH